MPTINEIVRRFGPAYLDRYGSAMLPSHRVALKALSECRTEKMGSHDQVCLDCGHVQKVFHSCKNRSCPLCFHKQTQNWLQVQEKRLLPVHYFHLVFTLPSQLRRIVRRHQKVLYPVLFKAAVTSLQSLAADKRYVGGQLGIMAVLHTWGGGMVYHPHLHLFVPGCGITPEGEVHLSRKRYLVPVRALSKKFRGCFLSMARKAVPQENFSAAGDIKKWNVYAKPVKIDRTRRVLEYLGRYLHRIAISNSAIIGVNGEQITFRYKKTSRTGKRSTRETMNLHSMEFLRRFFQHVLPKGMAKIRYYGFLSSSSKRKYRRVELALKLMAYLNGTATDQGDNPELETFIHPCPICGSVRWKILWEPTIPNNTGTAMPP